MRKELDELLCKKYPRIFVNRHGDMMSTAMCWGFDCSDGWFNIIDQFCRQAQWHIDQGNRDRQKTIVFNTALEQAINGNVDVLRDYYTKLFGDKDHIEKYVQEDIKNKQYRDVREEISQIVAVQVKEKFGTLRFYYDGGDRFIDGLESMAESMSAVTCEVCGSPGKLVGGGWVRTLCKTHAEEQNYNWCDEEKYDDIDYLPFGHPITKGDNDE